VEAIAPLGRAVLSRDRHHHFGEPVLRATTVPALSAKLVDPPREQILRFCEEDPVERVFLEDVARRGLGRFVGLEADGELEALCHLGVNVVPSGLGCGVFAREASKASPRMVIGEANAVSELWETARARLPRPREDRPGQPVFVIRTPPPSGETGLRQATLDDLELLMPACAAAHEQELGLDPLARDAEGFRWRTRSQIEDERSWLWEEDGVILFKAEASAWTPEAVQLQQVWVDTSVRRRGYGARGLQDLCRLLLDQVPTVCLFVRAENAPAIRLYETIGMEHVLDYRSLLF
jgi:ribosomal protein S18 acetylase RimI-like enzyme